MNYIIHEHGEVIEIIIEGNLLQENVAVLRNRFYDLIDKGKINIVLNMEQLLYISSLCLAVIVDIKKKLEKVHGDLKITNANRLVQNLLEITNLVRRFDLFEKVEDAVNSFKP